MTLCEGIVLRCVDARNLRNTEMLGTQDPYCSIQLNSSKQKFKTKTHTDGGKSATWNEEFTFNTTQINDNDQILVRVWNSNTMSDTKIGGVKIPLKSILDNGGSCDQYFQLFKERMGKGPSAGEVHLIIKIKLKGNQNNMRRRLSDQGKALYKQGMKASPAPEIVSVPVPVAAAQTQHQPPPTPPAPVYPPQPTPVVPVVPAPQVVQPVQPVYPPQPQTVQPVQPVYPPQPQPVQSVQPTYPPQPQVVQPVYPPQQPQVVQPVVQQQVYPGMPMNPVMAQQMGMMAGMSQAMGNMAMGMNQAMMGNAMMHHRGSMKNKGFKHKKGHKFKHKKHKFGGKFPKFGKFGKFAKFNKYKFK